MGVFLSHTPWLTYYVFHLQERAVGEGERMLDVLQRWGQRRAEVRFFLRHNQAPGRELGKCPSPAHTPATHKTDSEADTHETCGLDEACPQRENI